MSRDEEDQPDRSIWDEFAEALEKQGKRTGISIEYNRQDRSHSGRETKSGSSDTRTKPVNRAASSSNQKFPILRRNALATLGFRPTKFRFSRQADKLERTPVFLARSFFHP